MKKDVLVVSYRRHSFGEERCLGGVLSFHFDFQQTLFLRLDTATGSFARLGCKIRSAPFLASCDISFHSDAIRLLSMSPPHGQNQLVFGCLSRAPRAARPLRLRAAGSLWALK